MRFNAWTGSAFNFWLRRAERKRREGLVGSPSGGSKSLATFVRPAARFLGLDSPRFVPVFGGDLRTLADTVFSKQGDNDIALPLKRMPH